MSTTQQTNVSIAQTNVPIALINAIYENSSAKDAAIGYLLFIIKVSKLCLLSKYLLPTLVLNIESLSEIHRESNRVSTSR